MAATGTVIDLGDSMRRDPLKIGDERFDAGDDPASGIDGMPPNLGDYLLRHAFTFQGIAGSQAKVYRASDEAIQDSFDNAKFMRNDVTIMECVEMRQRAVALLDWSVEPEDANNAEQKEAAQILTKILEKIPRFMQYRENLLHATWYGKYGIQHKWGYRLVAGKMRPMPLRWLPVNGDKIVFRYDDGMNDHRPDQIGIRVGAGIYTGVNQLSQMQDHYRSRGFRGTVERVRKLEATDHGLAYFLDTWESILLAVHKHRIEDGDYHDPANAGRIHGVGIRSVIYWTWYQKQETLANMMDFMERSAMGIEIWYYPMGNATAKAEMRKAAEEKIENGRNIIMVPRPMGEDGQVYGVERIEPGMGGVESLKSIITEYFGHSIKRYILGQTLTTEASATGLGSNLADVQMDVFMQIVRYDSMLLEETITTDLLSPIKKLALPRMANVDFRFVIHTREPDAESMIEAFLKAYEMGLRLDAKQLRDLIGAPAPEPDSEVLDKFEQMKEQQAAAQSAQMGAMGPVPGANIGQFGDPSSNGQSAEPTPSAPAEAAEQAEYVANGLPSENSDRKRLASYAAFREEEHPRSDDGKFTDVGETAVATESRSKQTETPEFKAWFGDWENDRANSSKVVNKGTGEPQETHGDGKVVYHGTDADFDAFDPEKSGATMVGKGFYFAENKEIASMYASDDSHIRAVYLNIRRPFDYDSPIELEEAQRIVSRTVESRLISERESEEIHDTVSLYYKDDDGMKHRDLWRLFLNYRTKSHVNDLIASAGYDGITHMAGDVAGSVRLGLEREGDYGRVWIAFNPNQIKSATGNRGTFDPADDRIDYGTDWSESKHNRDSGGQFAAIDFTGWEHPAKQAASLPGQRGLFKDVDPSHVGQQAAKPKRPSRLTGAQREMFFRKQVLEAYMAQMV